MTDIKQTAAEFGRHVYFVKFQDGEVAHVQVEKSEAWDDHLKNEVTWRWTILTAPPSYRQGLYQLYSSAKPLRSHDRVLPFEMASQALYAWLREKLPGRYWVPVIEMSVSYLPFPKEALALALYRAGEWYECIVDTTDAG